MNILPQSLCERLSSLLQQRENELLHTLQPGENSESSASSHASEVTDFKDLAGDEAIAEVEDAKDARALAELSQVQAARRRLEVGSYGACLECGEPIDHDRLLILPSAALCTNCQSSLESLR